MGCRRRTRAADRPAHVQTAGDGDARIGQAAGGWLSATSTQAEELRLPPLPWLLNIYSGAPPSASSFGGRRVDAASTPARPRVCTWPTRKVARGFWAGMRPFGPERRFRRGPTPAPPRTPSQRQARVARCVSATATPRFESIEAGRSDEAERGSRGDAPHGRSSSSIVAEEGDDGKGSCGVR